MGKSLTRTAGAVGRRFELSDADAPQPTVCPGGDSCLMPQTPPWSIPLGIVRVPPTARATRAEFSDDSSQFISAQHKRRAQELSGLLPSCPCTVCGCRVDRNLALYLPRLSVFLSIAASKPIDPASRFLRNLKGRMRREIPRKVRLNWVLFGGSKPNINYSRFASRFT